MKCLPQVPRSRFCPLMAWMLLLSPGVPQPRAGQWEVSSTHISIRYNERFQREIRWLTGEERNIVAFDPVIQEGVESLGREYTSFRLDLSKAAQKRIVDPEFGPAIEATASGVLDDPDGEVRVERQVRILLPDRFPDAALFRSTYRNMSRTPLHLQRIISQRIVLDRRLAEPQAPSYALASYQGGAYKWGNDYCVIRLLPGFRQTNFQGVEDIKGPEGIGGGMPFIDAWGPSMGVALAHLEKEPQWLSLPVSVLPDNRVELAVTEAPQARLGQREWLNQGETYSTVLTAVIFHRLDYFDPIKIYGQLLRARGVAIPESSPPLAYEPYWKTWGWQRDFTLEKILGLLPELKAMGIHIANLDDGWYDYMGDWQLNRSPGKFPNGDDDMIAFVRKLHEEGFKTSLWWYPLGVSPEGRLAREHPELLVQGENGDYPLDPSSLFQLCPAYEPARKHIGQLLQRILEQWGFDGVYTDFTGLSSIPACFNKAHRHQSPLDSFRSSPGIFAMIHETLTRLKKSPHEVCVCSLPHSPYYMPFYEVASASDPINTWEVRSRVKAEKAIRGGTFAVGDCYQVPIQEWYGSSVPESFESAIGTGAQLTTFYTQLDKRQRELWNRWFHDYRDLGLADAEYLNLYDLAFDRPEVHVVRKAGSLYYGIFAEAWPRTRPVELRGLDRNTTYSVYDYGNRKDLGTVKGSEPFLKMAFKESLLLRLKPLDRQDRENR